MAYVISGIFLDLLRPPLWPTTWPISINNPCLPEEIVYFLLVQGYIYPLD